MNRTLTDKNQNSPHLFDIKRRLLFSVHYDLMQRDDEIIQLVRSGVKAKPLNLHLMNKTPHCYIELLKIHLFYLDLMTPSYLENRLALFEGRENEVLALIKEGRSLPHIKKALFNHCNFSSFCRSVMVLDPYDLKSEYRRIKENHEAGWTRGQILFRLMEENPLPDKDEWAHSRLKTYLPHAKTLLQAWHKTHSFKDTTQALRAEGLRVGVRRSYLKTFLFYCGLLPMEKLYQPIEEFEQNRDTITQMVKWNMSLADMFIVLGKERHQDIEQTRHLTAFVYAHDLLNIKPAFLQALTEAVPDWQSLGG